MYLNITKQHVRTRYMKATLSMVCIIVLCLTNSTKADYVVNKGISGDVNNFLYKATSSGVEELAKAGLKAVTTEILSTLGQSILASYSPALADLFFGGPSELEAAFAELTDEVRELHADLADRARDQQDEILDQYEVNIRSTLLNSINILEPILANESVFTRVESLSLTEHLWRDLGEARSSIETYIQSGANPERQYRRLLLLDAHAAISNLAILSGRLYWGSIAIKRAFAASGGSGEAEFLAWSLTLSRSDIDAIETNNNDYAIVKNRIQTDLLAFYNFLSTQRMLEEYIDSQMTPSVSQMVEFTGNTTLYDNADIVTARSSWGIENASFFARLDGLRWYYYVDIPNESCLRGFAYHELTQTAFLPWHEVDGQLTSSECNRHWMVDPYLISSGWPNSQLVSFDQYTVWFEDLSAAYTLHRGLIIGDLLRKIYGPSSLLLDQYYWDQHGDVRPRNRWDNLFREYDRQTTMLGSAARYTDGVSYSEIIAAVSLIDEYGGNDINLGLGDWFEAIKTILIDYEAASRILAAARDTQESEDWLYEPPKLSARQIRLLLVGNASAAQTYSEETQEDQLMAIFAPEVKRRTIAKYVALY